jgi:hypothetical protein
VYVEPDQRAELEGRIARIEESTEQRIHEAAKRLPDPERVDRRAARLTEKAHAHLRRSRRLRQHADDRNDSQGR